MATIHKKSYPPYFADVAAGRKNFDLRLADFEVASGDTIIFEEYDPATRRPTGRASSHRVGYVLKTKDVAYWTEVDIAKFGFVVMELKKEKEE